MKINKLSLAKAGSMALAVGLFVGDYIKGILDEKEEEARINDLVNEKVKEALESLGIKPKKETEENSKDHEDYEDNDESDESEEDEET